jgi:hypothetical protein
VPAGAGDLPDHAPRATAESNDFRGGFSAVKRIAPPPAEGLDHSWRKKVERDRRQSRKRRRRNRLVAKLIESPLALRVRKIGLVVISVVLVVTIYFLFINPRVGRTLIDKLFGN